MALRRVASLRILNTDDVEDVVQETLLTMTAKYPQEEFGKRAPGMEHGHPAP